MRFNKKYISPGNITIVLAILIAIQPILSLDYLAYETLNAIGLPRVSTLVYFLGIPILVMIGLFILEKNRLRAFIIAALYGTVVLIYFYFHMRNAQMIRDDLYLPKNFAFSAYEELFYVLTLILPYYLIYLFTLARFNDKTIEKIILGLSLSISLPIIIGNLFTFGMSTYEGYTKAPFFTWFFGIYDTYIPRQMASKFFFENGNTIGIVLLILLPILYYFLLSQNDNRKRSAYFAIIALHSLAMLMLSTRVATYGAILVALAILVLMVLFHLILRQNDFKVEIYAYIVILSVLIGITIPFTPAYVNMQIDRSNNFLVGEDNYLLDGGRDEINDELKKPKDKYDPAYVYAFEQYAIKSNLLSSVPSIYFMEWYKYTYDAKFWLDMMFNYPLEERANGRQVQEIFIKYKWTETPNPNIDHALGLGYSTIMNGSLILESDFVQQFYSFGYLGWILLMSPWLLLLIYGVVLFLKNFKKLFNMRTSIFAMSLVLALVSAYASGHTLDEFVSTVVIAFIAAILLTDFSKQNT